MAAVSILESPHALSTMTGRRAPLSSNLNAANSPYRGVAPPAGKQKRSYATIQREEAYGQPPPAKKQMLEPINAALKTPPRQSVTQAPDGRVFTRRSQTSHPTAFDKKLEAVRAKPSQQNVKVDRAPEENLETIRQWQKHYRRVFPKFVFYFESVPEDVRVRYAKHVTALGAREEKFFSNAVTHVVTTRTIPPERDSSSVETTIEPSPVDLHSQGSHPQTINPSLLDRSSESTAIQLESHHSKDKFAFDMSTSRRTSTLAHDMDVRRQQWRNPDVLHRARQLNIKIWALEKLQRMMTTMFDTDAGLQMNHGHNTRSNPTHGNSAAVSRTARDADLSQLLRNERLNGPSDRDPTVATKELNLFKGPFIYVHDIDEKQRPIMVREYAKVSNKEEGDWPQFRSVANGKCPFVEEVDYVRRDEHEKESARQQRRQEREKPIAPRTRAATAEEALRMQPPKASAVRRPLVETENASNRGKEAIDSIKSNSFDRPAMPLPKFDAEPSSKGHQNAFVSRAETGNFFAGEPVASGVQPSNITSAIRSQMISSTAAAPGAKAGTSKEVHGLQRKVLERNSGPASLGLTSSHRMTDLNAVVKEDANARLGKRRGQDQLGLIDEEFSNQELEEKNRRIEAARKAKAVQKRKLEKRDPKPGYCENCMEKFDDFDEHIVSRKHRRFAEKAENWKELDALLDQLERPLRDLY